MRLQLLVLVGLVACNGPDVHESTPKESEPSTGVDGDEDGYDITDDCNDADPTINPGATENWYDGIDQNCDGADDYDQDLDGYQGGTGPDCDDTEAAIYPGATEVCDGLDNDCSGEIDDAAVDALSVYVDTDLDGYGIGNPLSTRYCSPPEGTAINTGDCDDHNSAVNPGEPEVCDDIDNDCSGFVDDDPVDGTTWYADFDGDGYGDPNNAIHFCDTPSASYISDNTDCNDADPSVQPGAIEICDTVDQDCDGQIDEDAIDPSVWYEDLDGDGDGNPAVSQVSCQAAAGYVGSGGDCDDNDNTRNTNAYEACDTIDNNCNGIIDSDSPDADAWHPDQDNDGYGDAATVIASCDVIADWTLDGSDCDDFDATAFPGGTEICDGGDDDCDGMVDEADAIDAQPWYADSDGDLYGDPNTSIIACNAPIGYANNGSDCDDGNSNVNPSYREICDGLDNDCDTQIDESAIDATPWYLDADNDTFGDPNISISDCAAPSGYVGNDSDCDDSDANINPTIAESQDLIDQDCDGLVDEGFIQVGDIVVSEVARQPYAGGTGTALHAQAQWFEVYNSTATDINLSGWYFEEQDGDRFYLSPDVGLVVPAGGYAVLCYDDTWFATPSTCGYTWGDTSLGAAYSDNTFYFDRDEDLIALYLQGRLMDEVHWYPTIWPATAHYSMQLGSGTLDTVNNDDETSWCLSSNTRYSDPNAVGSPDYGTPGGANRSCP